ncbi:hypothetical protein BS50DRAFT_617765 [Corynespora cassiicola Philippines]|uniref:BZIP domain-containing protein n=1 Tax=Corynespora cassiicola Philippines TaxID=1448308 RepID=A0A2T2P4L1_CORCC|nr:hypothetical protein BS50DRAFT_617765 [Corynespora cassiicola Philippines]
MDLDTHNTNRLDWAHNAYFALNADKDEQTPAAAGWPTYTNAPSFTIPPSLLNDAAIERYGQITPPEDPSPADQCHQQMRESSIPVDELQNEVLWPDDQHMQLLQDYQPRQSEPDTETQPQVQPMTRASKRQRSAKQKPASQKTAAPKPEQQSDPTANPQPQKRKRGRPKSQPHTVEAFTSDGFPFQVTSARQSHLEKNRVAAHKCRLRKKEYINNLESRAREHSAKNKALKENVAMLREEVLGLKNEVLRHAGCGFWAVDEYLARCAGDLLGVSAPLGAPRPQDQHRSGSIGMATPNLGRAERELSTTESLPSQGMSDNFSPDDFGGLDLLEDYDEEGEDMEM